MIDYLLASQMIDFLDDPVGSFKNGLKYNEEYVCLGLWRKEILIASKVNYFYKTQLQKNIFCDVIV